MRHSLLHHQGVYFKECKIIAFERFQRLREELGREVERAGQFPDIRRLGNEMRLHLLRMLLDIDAALACVQEADTLAHQLEREIALLLGRVRQ